MTLIQLLEQARELAYRQHHYEDWGPDTCGAHEDVWNEETIKGVCNCGADQHNKKVDEVFEELTQLLIEKYDDKIRSNRLD